MTAENVGAPEPREFRVVAGHMGRVPMGSDLLNFLDAFVLEKGVRVGTVAVIGVVSRARLGFFDHRAGDYVVTEVPEHLEIASCLGNISERDGLPRVHAHLVVSGRHGEARGGHLLEGTMVHYAEFWVSAWEGRPFSRGHDPVTNVIGWVR